MPFDGYLVLNQICAADADQVRQVLHQRASAGIRPLCKQGCALSEVEDFDNQAFVRHPGHDVP